jgi:Skp family chaperone for outer membrane proteins
MRNRLFIRGVAAAALGLACSVMGGCTSSSSTASSSAASTFVVGVVDVERILPKIAEYNQAGDRYLRERSQLFKGLSPKATRAEADRFFTADKKREIQQAEQKWDEYKLKLQEETLDKVRQSATTVAKDKHLGLVLVSAPWRPLNQRMAVDITTDVLVDMQNSGHAVR